jgi:pimeloyl-ACP methyl ester carboxylesterase
MNESIDTATVELSVDGTTTTVQYRHGGTGPPVVFCHGIGLDAAGVSWRDALPAVAAEHTVYALNFPGHGGSEQAPGTPTTAYYSEVLEAFIRTHGLSAPVLVGTSMGGAVALSHTLNGGSPAGLVLAASYGLGSEAYWRTAAGAALRVPFADQLLYSSLGSRAGIRAHLDGMVHGPVSDALVADVYAAVGPESVETLRSWQRHEFRADGLRTDFSAQLESIEVPTLLLHGTEDPLLPVRWSRRAAERLPASELSVFEDCGHWLPRERPEACTRAIVDFCSQ